MIEITPIIHSRAKRILILSKLKVTHLLKCGTCGKFVAYFNYYEDDVLCPKCNKNFHNYK